MFERMKRAVLLEAHVYEEVEADKSATRQDAAVVALAAVSKGIGAAAGGPSAIVGGILAALFGWLVWSGVTYLIGDKLMGGTATWANSFAPSDSRRVQGCLGFSRSCRCSAAPYGS